MSLDVIALTKARSLLLILLATCEQTLLDAAANTLDIDMTDDLRQMIGRTESELAALNVKFDALRG